MIDITTYLLKTEIKPELTLVYVYIQEEGKLTTAVATDSFRLAEYILPEDMQDIILPGYYEVRAWKDMCKAYNKQKKDSTTILKTVEAQMAIQDRYKEYTYPKYKSIIPTEDNLKPFTSDNQYNKQYFIDMLKLIPNKKFNPLNFKDIQETSTMAVYNDGQLTLLLMALSL